MGQPLTIVDAPSAWTANDYPDLEQHVHRLSAEDVAELDTAVRHATLTGKKIQVPLHLCLLHMPPLQVPMLRMHQKSL